MCYCTAIVSQLNIHLFDKQTPSWCLLTPFVLFCYTELMLVLMLVYLNSRDHCIKHYLEDQRSTLSTFAADPDADDKSYSPQFVLTLMMLIVSLMMTLMMRLMMMLVIKGSSSPQEVSLSLLPTDTRCFVDLAEERSVYQTRPNVLEGPRDWFHCLRQHQPKYIRVKN